MTQAEALLEVLRIWASVGAVVAAVFLTIGMDRIDEDARGAYVFRPLLIPGVLVIWPLVLWRWCCGAGTYTRRAANGWTPDTAPRARRILRLE